MNREEWLMAALEEVSRKGGAKLRIHRLVKSLGVTKGSFYWHFKNREDFVHSLVAFWAEHTTGQVMKRTDQVQGNAQERLLGVMKIIFTEGLDKFELPMRAWAAEEPQVAPIIREVEARRLAYIRALFAEMGFQGQDLEMRTRLFICYACGEHVFFTRENPATQQQTIIAVHALLTRR